MNYPLLNYTAPAQWVDFDGFGTKDFFDRPRAVLRYGLTRQVSQFLAIPIQTMMKERRVRCEAVAEREKSYFQLSLINSGSLRFRPERCGESRVWHLSSPSRLTAAGAREPQIQHSLDPVCSVSVFGSWGGCIEPCPKLSAPIRSAAGSGSRFPAISIPARRMFRRNRPFGRHVTIGRRRR